MKNQLTHEFASVEATLSEYFDGLYFGDVERLKQVFHSQAQYACATSGEAQVLSMAQYWPVVEQRVSPSSQNQRRFDEIISIEFAGPVTAFARVECAILPKHFTDFLTLIKVDGRWQIIAKIFHYTLSNSGE